MQCEYYALEGLSDLVQTIKKVRAHLNPRLEIEGLLRTMYDPRNTLAQNVAAELEKHFGDKLYRTVDPAQRAARRGAVARHPGAASRHARRRARSRISRSPARCCAGWKRGRATAAPRRPPQRRTIAMIRPKGLGRGLDALLAGGDEADAHATRCRRSRSTACGPASTSRARGWTRRRSTSSRSRSASRASCSRSSCARSTAARFEIIAGERRWRAAQRAGLNEVPALVKAVPDQAALALALIENIQREDLNPLEEAQGLAAADRRVRPHARGGGQGGRPLAQRGHQPAAAARARRSRCRSTCCAGAARHGACARAARAAAGAADRRGGARRRAGAVGARHRAARPPPRSTRQAQGDARAPRARPTPTSRACRRSSPRRSAPRWRSSPRRAGSGRLVIGYSSLEQLDGILQRFRR